MSQNGLELKVRRTKQLNILTTKKINEYLHVSAGCRRGRPNQCFFCPGGKKHVLVLVFLVVVLVLLGVVLVAFKLGVKVVASHYCDY